ncbi:MAG: class II fructose-1,6-bisphosphate aldolase [Bacilli bacterium]|nr:class II fructose-1,6-bisphosphate aldolase [Bacilli bacterium]
MLVNLKEMLECAKKDHYAVPQFNINNLEWTRFILEECNANNSPVILGVSEGAIKYMGGYKIVVDIVKDLMDYLKIDIPVAIHLDHGSSFESCQEAIDNGFTSVMIDGSQLDLKQNIEITKKVVIYSKKFNVTVEGEIGHIGNDKNPENDGILYAEVDDCVKYCQESAIDFLAPALGSVHGLYKGEPKLNFERMSQISGITNLPLVLHGGTGIYDEQIRKSIECGIAKININTELQIAWSNAVKEHINDNNIYDPRKIIKLGEIALKECVRNKILLLGCKDKI